MSTGGASACANCNNDAVAKKLLSCNGCHSLAYCSPACQGAHWKAVHKAQCKSFAIRSLADLVMRTGTSALRTPMRDQDKQIALTWTLRGERVMAVRHILALHARSKHALAQGEADEVKQRLVKLCYRALTQVKWPTLPDQEDDWHAFASLVGTVGDLGGLREALELLDAHQRGVDMSRLRHKRNAAIFSITWMAFTVQAAVQSLGTVQGYISVQANLPATTLAVMDGAAPLLAHLTTADYGALKHCVALLVSVHAKARGVAFAARLLELSPQHETLWCTFRLANFLCTAGRLRESEDTIIQALALPTDASDHSRKVERAELLRLRAQVARDRGRPSDAIEYCILAMKGLDEAGAEHRKKILAALIAADLYDQMGRQEEALAFDKEYVGDMFAAGSAYRMAKRCLLGRCSDTSVDVLRQTIAGMADGATIVEGPGLPIRMRELLVQMLEASGTPQALAEAKLINEELFSMKRNLEAKWKKALEDTRAMAAEGAHQLPTRARGSTRRGSSSKKSKRTRKKDKSRAKAAGGDDALQAKASERYEVIERDREQASLMPPSPVSQNQEEGEEKEECSICFQLLSVAEDDESDDDDDAQRAVRNLPCSHAFHEDCLDPWFHKCAENRVETTCPMCRRQTL